MIYEDVSGVIKDLEDGNGKDFEEIGKRHNVEESTVSSIFSKERHRGKTYDKVFDPKYSNTAATIAVAFEDYLSGTQSDEVNNYTRRKRNQYENAKSWFKKRWGDRNED